MHFNQFSYLASTSSKQLLNELEKVWIQSYPSTVLIKSSLKLHSLEFFQLQNTDYPYPL